MFVSVLFMSGAYMSVCLPLYVHPCRPATEVCEKLPVVENFVLASYSRTFEDESSSWFGIWVNFSTLIWTPGLPKVSYKMSFVY